MLITTDMGEFNDDLKSLAIECRQLLTTVCSWFSLEVCFQSSSHIQPVFSTLTACQLAFQLIHYNSSHKHYMPQNIIQVICWEAGVWLPALNNFCHSFLSSAVLLSATYLPFITSLSKCILFLPRVEFPLFLSSIISCSNDSCLSTCPNHTLDFLTACPVSFNHCRTSSLLILSTQLIFSILLQIHISMACNLFLSAWITDRVSDTYNITLNNTLFYYSLFQH